MSSIPQHTPAAEISADPGSDSSRWGEGPQTAAPRQKYWIPRDTYVCATRGGFVFLDLRRNRYFAISEHQGHALSACVHDWPSNPADCSSNAHSSVPSEQVAELLNCGLLTSQATASKSSAAKSISLEGLMACAMDLCSTRPRIRGHHVFNFVRACVWTTCVTRLFSLSTIVSAVRRRKARKAPLQAAFNAREAAALAEVFRLLRPWAYRADGHCIHHALAVLRFLSYYGFFPIWVIGVTLRPWRAHSWVQYDALVLDTTPNRVTAFTPILTV